MAAFTDDFNRANSSDLGAGWVEVSGDWSIDTNRLSPGAGGGTIILRAATAMASNDHYAQVTIATTTSASQGVWCRGNANITSGYLWRNDGSNWTLFRVLGGSFTSIGSYTAAAAPGDVAKVQAVGSTIKGFVNGVQRVSVTDTDVATGTSVGIRAESVSGLRFDDFAAEDVTAGTTLNLAAAVETAQSVTGAKGATLNLAAATETAQALTGSKTVALGTALATEAARPIVAAAGRSLVAAAAVEIAQPLTGAKSATLGPALETSTARPLTAAGADEDIDITFGAPYSQWTAGAPHTDAWEVGAPW